MAQEYRNEQPDNNTLKDVNLDQAVLSLMAIAETYRSAKIPRYKMAIKCALVIFFYALKKFRRP